VYLGARVGMYKPSDADQLDPFSFETGLDVEGFVGYRLHPNLSVEVGLGYTKSSTNTLSASDPAFGDASVDFERSDMPITASVRAGIDADRVTFYALAGVAYHMTELKVNLESDLASGSLFDEADVFGWHLGGGLAVALTPRLSLGAEVRRTFVSADYPDLLGPEGLGAPTTELKLDGLQLGATIMFRL